MNLNNITACLLTKEDTYPQVILDNVNNYPFKEVLIGTHSPSPYMKHELFKRVKTKYIFYCDDDAIVPIDKLLEKSKPNIINVGMKSGHYEAYQSSRATMGLGWGAIFPKSLLESLTKYTDKYGYDSVYQRETERIFTYLNYPQNRIVLDITDLPSAYAEDRLWRQADHELFKELAISRCRSLVL